MTPESENSIYLSKTLVWKLSLALYEVTQVQFGSE